MTTPNSPRPRRRARPGNGLLKWLLLAVCLAGAAYVYRDKLLPKPAPAYPANAFFDVKRGDMLISITEEGALRALNETTVRSALEGLNRIIHLVPEGAHVKKGELIVELDSSGLKDRLNEQELLYQERLAQFLQATNNLQIQKSSAESQIKDAELKVENAQMELEKYRDGDAPLQLKTIDARIAILKEQVRIAAERSARTEQLFLKGNATRSELEADALSLKREELGLTQYEEDLRLIKKFDQPNQIRMLESRLVQAKGDLDRLKQRSSNQIAEAEADLKTSQRALTFLEDSLKTQRRRLENSKIYAPQDGLVVYAAVSPFQFMGGSFEGRREEGRFRGDRGSGGFRGFGGDSGEYRGGSSRGGRSGSSSGSSLSSSGGGSSISSSSGGSPSAPANASMGSGGGAQAGGSAGQGSASFGGSGGGGGGGGGSRGGGGSGGGSSGGEIQSASRSFVSYPSMRQSSSFASSSSSSGGGSSGGSESSSSSSSSGGGGGSYSGGYSSGSSQYGYRSSSSSQYSSSFPGSEFFGASGVIEEGAMVRQRQDLIQLPDVSKMLAEIKVHESRVQQVKAGMTAFVRVENVPNRRFKGTVRRVAPLPDSQMSWMNPNLKVFSTDILIEEELPIMKPGVSARAEILITNLSKVLSVPIQTVARHRGQNVCFVKRPTGVVPVPVVTGWFNDGFMEITSGLKEGDQVLLAPEGDEAIEAAPAETNQVQATQPQAPSPERARPEPQLNDTAGDEPRMQRRGPDSPEGGPRPERRRGRPGGPGGGRRPQNSEESPE